jgi:hypothetical protein
MLREIGREISDESLLAVAWSRPVPHARRMSATPVRQQRYPHGVALFGVLFASGLVLAALSLGFLWMVVARDGRLAVLVAALGAVLAVTGATALAETCLSYQARPSPRPPVGPALVWRPTAAVRAEMALSLVGITMVGLSAATVGATPIVIAAIVPWLFCIRILFARLEADRWGIRCTNPLTTVRIPWSDVRSLEPRGTSALRQSIVAVTEQGREQPLWVVDPRVPASRDTARLLVAELEAVRRMSDPRPPHLRGT